MPVEIPSERDVRLGLRLGPVVTGGVILLSRLLPSGDNNWGRSRVCDNPITSPLYRITPLIMSRFALLASLIAGSALTLFGCAQGMSGASSSTSPLERRGYADTTIHYSSGEVAPVDSVPWAADSTRVPDGSKRAAFEAAAVDPGFLIYTEPPPGTDTTVYTPPEGVDPGMIWRPKP